MGSKYHYYLLAMALAAACFSSLMALSTKAYANVPKVPEEWGSITQSHPLDPSIESPPTLFIIQDAHANYSAQKNLAHILEFLITQHSLHYVFVEGGQGNVTLNELRQWGDLAVRQEIAEENLKSGMFTGEEYLTVASDLDFEVWGIEDPQLYEQNYLLHKQVTTSQQKPLQQLGSLQQTIEQLQQALFSETLQQFVIQEAAFDSGHKNLDQFVVALKEALTNLEHAEAFSAEVYPEFWKLLLSQEYQSQIQLDQVKQQQKQLAATIVREQGDAGKQKIQQLAQDFKSKKIDKAGFYRTLIELAEHTSIDLSASDQLQLYTEQLELNQELSPKRLWEELNQIRQSLKWALAQETSQRQLIDIMQRMDKLKRLAELKWTSADYDAYLEQAESYRLQQWLPELIHLAETQSLTLNADFDAAALDEWLMQAAEYYRVARARDDSLVQQTLKKMQVEKQQFAVMIQGGFHTDHCVEMLLERGVEVHVIAPQVGAAASDKSQYNQILEYKFENRLQGVL